MEQLTPKLMSWASILEDDTRLQAERISRLPFIYPHVALMPDAHLGKGATVGSVVPTFRAVIPAAVGVDIGCGMIAVRTHFKVDELRDDLQTLREMIQMNVPTSAGRYNNSVTPTADKRITRLESLAKQSFDPSGYARNWTLQLGTLGSGNHFIEVVRDEQDRVWAFIHSGSRGIGNKIAQRHIEAAVYFHRTTGTKLEDPDLAWLVEGTPEFARYITEMEWAQQFAWLNREEMMDRVLWCLSSWMGVQAVSEETVHCHHNYTTRERHHGREVWLTRKGAIAATTGQRGLIPGSMGDASYVVSGLGNQTSLHSAPHGAGRRWSRSKAKKMYTADDLKAHMRGIEYDQDRASAFIDEIPDAYKPIDQVMADAQPLVEIVHTFRQIINVKGD